MSSDANLSDSADRTHRVYWGSHGCVLPYRHVGPCVCDCALIAVERVHGHGSDPHDGLAMILVDTSDPGWTPTAGDWRVFGDDVYGPPNPDAPPPGELYANEWRELQHGELDRNWPRWTGADPQEL